MSDPKLHVAHVGKQRKKDIRRLMDDNSGELAYRVQETVSDALLDLGTEAGGKEVVPVIIILEQKPKKRRFKTPQWALVRLL